MKMSKITSTIVVIIMVLSTMLVFNNASAQTVTLSKDGSEGAWAGLTCGEIITFEVKDNGLNASETYSVKVWNGTDWVNLRIEGNKKADKYGDIELEIHVPGWKELGYNPITNSGDPALNAGEYDISLFDNSGTQVTANSTIQIRNLYIVKFFNANGTELQEIIYNKSYFDFTIKVYNWTGSSISLEEDEPFQFTIVDADGNDIYQKTGEDETWVYDLVRSENNFGDGSGNLENFLWVNITNEDFPTLQYTNATLPVKLDPSFTTIPTDNQKSWGDTVTVSGYLYDGQGNSIGGYPIKLYSPVDGGYKAVASTTTYGSGKFVLEVDTGSGSGKDDYASAGTWYVGTEQAAAYRVDETDILDITNFISYGSFKVSTKDNAVVDVVDTGDIIANFNQTFNITVSNASWMKENEYRNMIIHVTGLEGWWQGVEYDDKDIVPIASSVNITKYTDSKAWYEFNYRFNETGNAKIWASWPGNLTSIAQNNPDGQDSTYSNTYGNEDLLANITGFTTLPVISPGDINLVIPGTMVDAVQVTEISATKWQNSSDTFILYIYGDSEDEPMNATIEITGAGLDIKINESDSVSDNEYLIAKSDGMYQVQIAPKIAGTLTIKATNETDNYTTSQDFDIKGLIGSVTTSVGDDLEIEVESSETITVTVANGQYSTVVLTLFDETWTTSTAVNKSTGDNTAGNGLNGVFEFVPDEDHLDEIGFIVCAAKAGSNIYLYDIVEITPVHDLELEAEEPTEGNDTLTVGIPQNIKLQVRGPTGGIVDDIDTVTGKLYDSDDKLKQEISFTESGEYWQITDQIIWFAGTLEITAKNNTGLNEHDGEISFDVSYATFTFTPDSVTAGIGEENISVEVTGIDANGNTLPDGTSVYINIDAGGTTTDKNSFSLDTDGAGEFKIKKVGDKDGKLNLTFEDFWSSGVGNKSIGKIIVEFPFFDIDPSTAYIGQSNVITIYAYKADMATAVPGINLTLFGNTITNPEPVETDADGKVIFSINPSASGFANVTIARNVSYTAGALTWTNDVITDTFITITSLKTFSISVSKSPIYEAETLTVTITTGTTPVADVSVTIGEETAKTDSNGEATFSMPDPGVDSAIYTITAEKAGYITAEKSITIIKLYDITIVGPAKIEAGKSFTVTVVAKGQPLAGAVITYNGNTVVTDGEGKAKVKAPSKIGDITITATFGNYKDGVLTLTITKAQGTPGFELLTLIIALGVAFILIRRRRK